MDKKDIKKILASASVAALLAGSGVGLTSCAHSSAKDGAVKGENGKSSCGKGSCGGKKDKSGKSSCGKGSCGGKKDKDK